MKHDTDGLVKLRLAHINFSWKGLSLYKTPIHRSKPVSKKFSIDKLAQNHRL
jgi:hypothetical protein